MNLLSDMVSMVAAPIAIAAGVREYTLIIEEPMRGRVVICEIAPCIAKFSMPHVSGTHIVLTFVFESDFVHEITSWTVSKEPRLHEGGFTICVRGGDI